MPNNDRIRDRANEFNDKLKDMSEKLELSDKQQIIGIDFKENIKLGGTLERNNIFVVKIKDENGDIHHIVMSRDLDKIADINKDGKIELSEDELKKWEQFIGTREYQNAEQKKRYDFEKVYVLDEYKMDEKAVNNNDKTVGATSGRPQVDEEENAGESIARPEKDKDEETEKVAEALNVNQAAIVAMIKIEDRENFGQAINKKLYADTYIVKYGNNKTKIMQMDSKGKLKEIAGLESNEFNQDVMEQLNVDKRKDNQKIKAGDLKTIKTEDSKYSYVVVREQDPKKGIVIVNSRNSTKVYTFDDEGKDTLKEIETSIKYEIEKENVGESIARTQNDSEKDYDEDEGRTLWGDAYARQRQRR